MTTILVKGDDVRSGTKANACHGGLRAALSNSDQQPALNSRRLRVHITWPQRDTKRHKIEILYHQAAISIIMFCQLYLKVQ